MRLWKHCLAVCALTCSPLAVAAPPVVNLSAGIHLIHAQVMNTQQGRMRGLMHRTGMAVRDGMLFVFPEAERHCMWMKNTLLPLSVAFIDDAGRIVNIEDMQPQTENIHCADAPVHYALEMNRGWFAMRGVKSGSTISGLDQAPAAVEE